MKAQRPLRHVIRQVLLSATLGTAVVVSPGQGAGAHLHASQHQRAVQIAFPAADASAQLFGGKPWMNSAIRKGPWMYVATAEPRGPRMYAATAEPRGPWMYVATAGPRGPWMYAATRQGPWMYAATVRQ